MNLLTVVVFVFVLTVLVLFHELGHFIVAKFFKIKVEEFGFGLPPRIFGKKFGETVYSLNWLPIGGFVKLFGEDEAGAGKISKLKAPISHSKKAFYSRPWYQRALVIVAGVAMNFLLSVIIFSVLFSVVGIPVFGDKVIVEKVISDSPAQVSGLRTGDVIEFLNGVKITSSQQVIELTKKYLGQKISIMVLSGQEEKTFEIMPRANYPKDQGPMGVVIKQNFEVKRYSWYQAPIAGFGEAINQTKMLLSAAGALISQIFVTGQVPEYSFAGPVGVAQLTGRYIEFGPTVLLSFVSLLSLNLMIVNILPIPALDGGRLFFILIEAVTRRKVHPKFESYAHTIGMALLLALIVLITIHDLIRILSGQPILPAQ